jgi:hypothetical protein
MWRLETNVNGEKVTTVLASLKIAYLAMNSLGMQRWSHMITRMR